MALIGDALAASRGSGARYWGSGSLRIAIEAAVIIAAAVVLVQYAMLQDPAAFWGEVLNSSSLQRGSMRTCRRQHRPAYRADVSLGLDGSSRVAGDSAAGQRNLAVFTGRPRSIVRARSVTSSGGCDSGKHAGCRWLLLAWRAGNRSKSPTCRRSRTWSAWWCSWQGLSVAHGLVKEFRRLAPALAGGVVPVAAVPGSRRRHTTVNGPAGIPGRLGRFGHAPVEPPIGVLAGSVITVMPSRRWKSGQPGWLGRRVS